MGGLDAFLPYVRDYVNTFMGKSINTDIWKEHLYNYWRTHGGEEKVKILDSVDWNVSTALYFPSTQNTTHNGENLIIDLYYIGMVLRRGFDSPRRDEI